MSEASSSDPPTSLDEFKRAVGASVVTALIERLLGEEARRHYKEGHLSGCACSVCSYRRSYVWLQSQSNYSQGGRELAKDNRYFRKEADRAYKKKVLGDLP